LLSPQCFFDKYYNGTLEEVDFNFVKKGQDEKSVKGTVRRKIKILPDMMELFKSGLQAEENFEKNKVFCSFAADGSCTLGFSESEKVRLKSLIKGNELNNPKAVELVLRKEAGAAYFDVIIVGDEVSLEKYRNRIESMLADKMSYKNS